jgi:hypothetical protein
MRLALLVVVLGLLAACGASSPGPGPALGPDPATQGEGLRYAPDRVLWPAIDGELRSPPLGGIVWEDSGGRRWTLWRRPGAQLRPEDAPRALPQGSPAPDLAVRAVLVQGGQLEGAPGDGGAGERWVLLRADGEGAPTRRVVGWWSDAGAAVAPGFAGPALAVRLTSAAAPPRALRVSLEAPGCEAEGEALRGELERALSGVKIPVAWGESPADAALRVRCEGGRWSAVEVEGRSGRLLRTPYWSPSSLTLPEAEGVEPVVAVLASLAREPQAALWALRAPGERAQARRMLAALALEAGWVEGAEATLDGDEDEVAALLRAGAREVSGGAGVGALLGLKGEGPEWRYRAASARALAAWKAKRPKRPARRWPRRRRRAPGARSGCWRGRRWGS